MAKITVKQLEALTPADDGITLREEGGLTARVRAGVRGVTALFRFEFKMGGAKRDHRLGSWPKKSLAQIRVERDAVKASVHKGIDPATARKASKIEAQAAVAATIAEAERQAAENRHLPISLKRGCATECLVRTATQNCAVASPKTCFRLLATNRSAP